MYNIAPWIHGLDKNSFIWKQTCDIYQKRISSGFGLKYLDPLVVIIVQVNVCGKCSRKQLFTSGLSVDSDRL